jgi:small subunit ribosomal protein S21
MAVVNVNPGESIESALRRFKRKVMTEEIIKDAKKHAFFMPPGQKAKLKSALGAQAQQQEEGPLTPAARLALLFPPFETAYRKELDGPRARGRHSQAGARFQTSYGVSKFGASPVTLSRPRKVFFRSRARDALSGGAHQCL